MPWVIDIPAIRREELPMFIEHKVQSPSEEITDDPSMIFFDPDERADFVYKAVPYVTQDLDFSYVQPRLDELTSYPPSVCTTKALSSSSTVNEFSRRNSLSESNDALQSPQYDDSLDGQSQKNTNNFFDNSSTNNLESSQNDLLDFDDRLSYPMPPRLESTRNEQHSIHSNRYQQDIVINNEPASTNFNVDDYARDEVNLYEEHNLFSEVRNLNFSNKGYVSDAESIKTYQDSGVYDGDLADSPKSIGSVARQLVFDDYENEEKFAAFKTPMSSRQSSVESLLMHEYATLKDFSNNEMNQRNQLDLGQF